VVDDICKNINEKGQKDSIFLTIKDFSDIKCREMHEGHCLPNKNQISFRNIQLRTCIIWAMEKLYIVCSKNFT
jgi:hypothetical protein